MRNRAKCKKCNAIIESFVMNDLISCECKAIAISGGAYRYEVFANDFNDVIRIDDDDKEIIPKIVNKSEQEQAKPLPKREELLEELDRMIENIDKLPPEAKMSYINHYELGSLLVLLSLILRSD